MNKTIGAAALAAAIVTTSAMAGDAAKPTIVLVHGAFADASGWYGVITQLNKDGYTAIARPTRCAPSAATPRPWPHC